MDAPKKRGRPPKEKEVVEEVVPQEVEPSKVILDIKHVFRALSLSGGFEEEGAEPASYVESYLQQEYFDQGYDLIRVEHVRTIMRETQPYAEQMLYILVKYAQ